MNLRKLLDESNEMDKCKFCEYQFRPGENLFEHYSEKHLAVLWTFAYMDIEEMRRELREQKQ